ncbi:MAG: hypothetical protein HRU76_04995 [Phycisphaeraceae bacterium]|nr:hypothetical protein [Phycisphaerales bacterium]QOJ16976.1 MAG: hypothetical protein HRU76_04995 [Phycisphaeraceae bacterium]
MSNRCVGLLIGSLVVAMTGVIAAQGSGGIAEASSHDEPPRAAIDSLIWLAGGWRSASEDGKASSEEHWVDPAGGAMLGVNRTIQAGKMVLFEFLRIEEREGTLIYLAQPGGRTPATTFTLVEMGEHRAVFANPAHDFPQRIEYRRDGDTLHARVSGSMNGKEAEETWAWKRVGAADDTPKSPR